MKKYFVITISILLVFSVAACSRQPSAANNNKMVSTQTQSSSSLSQTQNSSAASSNKITQAQSNGTGENNEKSLSPSSEADSKSSVSANRDGYHYNIEADKKTFNAEKIDIHVGDNYFATQINDWYANFAQYEGKTVEIEGYYILSAPYTFVGRFGPSCPYCTGGYVSFEIYTTDDLTSLKSDTDWITVKGILRQGKDSSGVFYYIEAMSIKKGVVGKDTVKN